jgi:ABC-2 type transport system ATP-binding protein
MNTALRMDDITKVYDRRTVVDQVSLAVERGETFGLLGPNGSGKTTTIRMALDIIRPDSGGVSLLGGTQTREALNRVGYLPEERGLYQKSNVTDILTYMGRLKKLDASKARARALEMLERVGLYEHRAKKVQALSRGMTQLTQFAGALLHEPELIILDEPFSGLDPLNVQLMKEILREQQARGAAVIFSTHQMPDVEELCERVLLINEGQTLLYGRLADLKRARGTRSVQVTAERHPDAIHGVVHAEVKNGSFEYLLSEGTRPDDVLRSYLEAGIPVERYEVALPSLNEMFIDEVSRARNAQ